MTLFVCLYGNSYPMLYSSLGNKLFDANNKFEKIKSIGCLTRLIDDYQNKSYLILQDGRMFEISTNLTASQRKHYLDMLRHLDEYYNYIIGALQQELLNSIYYN